MAHREDEESVESETTDLRKCIRMRVHRRLHEAWFTLGIGTGGVELYGW